jgi:ribonucleotide reductase alpha subunit
MSKKENTKNLYEELSSLRKEWQENGDAPEWMTTGGIQLLKEKYLLPGQTPKQRYKIIADTAAQYLPNSEEWSGKFFDLFWKGWLSPSTPVLSNMGTDKGMAVSCSGGYIHDSIDGFYSGRKEAALLTKYGFGTSGYLGAIRPRGSVISSGGKASGVLPVFKGFVQDMRDVAQGTSRRGAWAGYIEPEHDDFNEILHFIETNPDDANIGWVITENFINSLDNEDPEMIHRFQKMLKMKMVTGKGYFFFKDKVNANRPDTYKHHDLDVKSSNLCLTGDTIIEIKTKSTDVHGKRITLEQFISNWNDGIYNTVWIKTWLDGNEIYPICWPTVSAAAQTGTTNILYELTTNTYNTIKCTPLHQIYTKNRGWVAAQDLTYNDILIVHETRTQPYRETKLATIKQCLFNDAVPVYDLTVPETSSFFANDVLVHNCSEIALHQSEDYTFTCVLSSMNAAKYDEWKNTDAVYTATVFLDCVAEDFIQKGSKIKGLDNAVNFTKKGRALGLGVCGFHTYLQEHMMPFGSMESFVFNDELFSHINDESKRASEFLAKELGEPDWCKGFGLRNTHRMAIAPTKSCVVPETKFMDGSNKVIDYYQFCDRGGIDLDNIMKITIELEDDSVLSLNWNDKVSIVRDGVNLVVNAADMIETDDFLGVSK